MREYKPTKCDVCGGKVVWKKSSRAKGGYIYECTECGATVGTMPKNPKLAMGTLADFYTRKKRREVHLLFDRFWKGNLTRKKNYTKLAEEMGIPVEDCHFGYMNLEQLTQAEQILLRWWREKYDK